MQERIIQFIAALRAAGVRISLAESADAFYAIEQLGIQDRDAFRTSLRATLVKHYEHLQVFDQLFPIFFDHLEPQSLPNVHDGPDPRRSSHAGRRLAPVLRAGA